jgi:Tol biopolymer transport system component
MPRSRLISALLLCLLFLATMQSGLAQGQYQFAPSRQLVIPGSAPNGDFGPSLSADNLTLYFNSEGRAGGRGGLDMWQTNRATPSGPFSPPVNLGAGVNTSSDELIPKTALDGLSLYFVSDRPGTLGGRDAWVASRASTGDSFSSPVNLGMAINSTYLDGAADISADGLTLVFNSDRPTAGGPRDLYIATRATGADPFGPAVKLGLTINTANDEFAASISADALRLLFSSDRPGGLGDYDIWVSSRASLSAPWGAPVNLGSNVNTPFTEYNPEISWDGSRIVFTSTQRGLDSIFEAAVIPEPSTLVLMSIALCVGTWLCVVRAGRISRRDTQSIADQAPGVSPSPGARPLRASSRFFWPTGR